MVSVWVWHIVAGLVGSILSLSIFYIKLEKWLSVYRPLDEKDIERIVDENGSELSTFERKVFLTRYNQLVFIGRTTSFKDYNAGVTIYFRSGEKIQMVRGERFYEVRRLKRSGTAVYFRLFEKHQSLVEM